MEIPSAENVGKFFGGIIIAIAAAWTTLKKLGFIDKKTVEEPIESTTRYLRRSEDAGLRVAIEELEKRIGRVEDRFVQERDFFLGQLRDSEMRLSSQVREVGDRIDEHYQGINNRLDNLLKGK